MYETPPGTVPPEPVAVRDPRNGRLVHVKGVGALRRGGLEIAEGVDLVKPIAEQALLRSVEKPKLR